MTPYIYCEPFCGMAGVFYWSLGTAPPISYMGSKRFYASVIADILGLSRHHRPAAVVLGDVGPTVAVHAGLFGALGVTARDVAGMLAYAVRTLHLGGSFCRPVYDTAADGRVRNRYRPESPAEDLDPPPTPRAQTIAAIIRSWKDEEPRALWTRLKAEGWPSLMPPKGTRWGQPIVGRWLGPVAVEEVAAWVMTRAWVHPTGENFAATKSVNREVVARDGSRHTFVAVTPETQAASVGALPSTIPPLACYQGTASRLVEQLPGRLDGWICYLDPPYFGTTGYPFGGCGREEVLRIALDLHRRGATVAISEAVRLDRELGEGWYAVDISHARKGRVRTFTKNQGSNKREPQEWVTVNRAPVNVPGKQQGLFGATAEDSSVVPKRGRKKG